MPGADAGRAAGAVKVAGILAFVFLAGDTRILGDRIEELIRNHDGYLGVLVFGLLWVVCLAGTLAAGFLVRFWMRVVFAFPLLAGALIGMVYEEVAGSAVDYDNASIMREEILLAGSALSFFASPARMAVLLTLLGGVALLMPPPRLRRPDRGPAAKPLRRRCGPGSLGPAAVAAAPFVAVSALIVARGGYGTSGLPVHHTVPILFAMVELDERLSAAVRREPVRLPLGGAAAPPPHVVLVIDESVRGDYLDLNVERGTTQSLLRHRSRVVNFGHAVAAANCSATTHVILRTGAMPPTLREDAYTNPYVWDYARRAGMRTVYVEAQTSRPSLRNRLSLRELARIDEFVYQDGETRRDRDLAAVDSISAFVMRSEPQFIFLVKSGVHFPYDELYPAEGARFRPHLQPDRATTSRTRLKNSYGNAIAWNVDPFFEKLLSEVEFDETVLLYTSDHGQNLLDNGRTMTHCSTDETSYFEGLVPMLAVTH